jgi:hypothetical protein
VGPDDAADSVPWFLAHTDNDGKFSLHHVPPGEDLVIEWGSMPHPNARHLCMPKVDGSIGDLVFPMVRR